MESEKEIRIHIPDLLYRKLLEVAKDIGIDNVEEFIIYILEMVVETYGSENSVERGSGSKILDKN